MKRVKPAPYPVRLLDQPIGKKVAAEILGVDAVLFDNAPRLHLRDAFRIALRGALEARQASRGQRRAVLHSATAQRRRAAKSVPGDLLVMAIRIAARQAADRLDGEAAIIAKIDPKAADDLRKAAQAALNAANADADALNPYPEGEHHED